MDNLSGAHTAVAELRTRPEARNVAAGDPSIGRRLHAEHETLREPRMREEGREREEPCERADEDARCADPRASSLVLRNLSLEGTDTTCRFITAQSSRQETGNIRLCSWPPWEVSTVNATTHAPFFLLTNTLLNNRT